MMRSNVGLRHYLRRRFNRLRDKSRNFLKGTGFHLPPHTQADPSLAANIPASGSQRATATASSLPLNQASNVPGELTNTGNDEAQTQTGQGTSHGNSPEQNSTTDQLAVGHDIGNVIVSSDLWSAAYREAVENLRQEIDIATLEGKNVAQLFEELHEAEQEATRESAFSKGLRHLRLVQVPLERIKLALDLASPMTNLEPTAATVFGVLRSVTAIAISFATADLDFAKQIGEMLEQIPYIDGCDTLGQKAGREDIHKALVLVYEKILEFYKVALEILSKKGVNFMMQMVWETDRLPNIVQDFLRYSDTLRKLIDKATFEIVEDIKSMLYDQQIAGWLGEDKVSRQSQYHESLQDLRANQACEFLLEHTNFTNWYDGSDSQQLVILGHMGCGKTLAMTFLVDELMRRKECQPPQPKICYYYCRDNETDNGVSIISTLIISLLKQLPGLAKPFFEWCKQAQASGILDPAKNIKKLEEFLQKLLEAIERPVFFVIDGLDECDAEYRNRLLKLLKTLSQKTSGLKTILSSRPQEEILEQMDKMARIELVPDAQRDGIIVQKTVESKLPYLSTDVKALVIEELSRLAQGSAIWTKMIIELIELRKIRAFNPMQCFLREMPLPRQLSELYATIFSRCILNDPENEELVSTALKLLAITRRPLSILELAWAATLGAAKHVTTMNDLAQLVDHQRVMSLIHPFITRVDFSDVKKHQVQLTHQSVKEFIINKPHSQGPTLTRSDQMICDQILKSLETFILDICTRYLLLDDIDNRDLFSEEQVGIAELPQEFDLFNDNEEPTHYDGSCTWEVWEEDMIRYDPADRGFGEFFVYASSHWLEHFGAIAVKPLPSVASITDLCQVGSTRFHNWTQQNCRPGCTITARFQFDSSLYDPLSITSLYGPEAMLHDMLENSDFNEDKFLQNTAMKAADQIFQWGDLSRLRILFLDDKLGHQLQNLDFFSTCHKNVE